MDRRRLPLAEADPPCPVAADPSSVSSMSHSRGVRCPSKNLPMDPTWSLIRPWQHSATNRPCLSVEAAANHRSAGHGTSHVFEYHGAGKRLLIAGLMIKNLTLHTPWNTYEGGIVHISRGILKVSRGGFNF